MARVTTDNLVQMAKNLAARTKRSYKIESDGGARWALFTGDDNNNRLTDFLPKAQLADVLFGATRIIVDMKFPGGF